MFSAMALFIALVGGQPAPLPEVCELPNAIPGKTTSASCMGCHDGTIGPAATNSFPDTLEGFPNAGHGGSHPVERDYAFSALRRPGSLTPLLALPRELVLNDGQITCVTCHHPKSKERFRTSLSMSGSGLCLACHQK